MITIADENYLKEIYALELDHEQVTTSMLADRFGYSPATITGMLKKLSGNGWVTYKRYQGVNLTESGRAIALEVIRHHRLLETFLYKELKIPWERVHEEAERLEHVLSDYLEERIDDVLGHPSTDPHGAPIPTIDGMVVNPERLRLSDLSIGDKAEIIEISDNNPEFLVHLGKLKITPLLQFSVTAFEPIDELITIMVHGQNQTLGKTSASHIIVKRITNQNY
jgi:DtxR family Mn-dependent transcriptional regulator